MSIEGAEGPDVLRATGRFTLMLAPLAKVNVTGTLCAGNRAAVSGWSVIEAPVPPKPTDTEELAGTVIGWLGTVLG
jgi:hypothetical protein